MGTFLERTATACFARFRLRHRSLPSSSATSVKREEEEESLPQLIEVKWGQGTEERIN